MSYSRWMTSYWYTFWLAPPKGTEDNRDTATFCICNLMGSDIIFSAKNLRERRSTCIKEVRKQDPLASNADIKELNVYIGRFLDDVNEKYPQ